MTGSDYSKSQHLGFVQDVVKRLAGNSFLLKGWAITLCTALIALGISAKKPNLILVAAASSAIFCLLDAYYLQQERRYRELYDVVRQNNCSRDCEHSVPSGEYCLHTKCVRKSKSSYAKAFSSPSVWLYYTVLVAAPIAVWFVLR